MAHSDEENFSSRRIKRRKALDPSLGYYFNVSTEDSTDVLNNEQNAGFPQVEGSNHQPLLSVTNTFQTLSTSGHPSHLSVDEKTVTAIDPKFVSRSIGVIGGNTGPLSEITVNDFLKMTIKPSKTRKTRKKRVYDKSSKIENEEETIDQGAQSEGLEVKQHTLISNLESKSKERARRRCRSLARTKIIPSQEEEDDDGLHPRWKPAKRSNSKLFEESELLFYSKSIQPTKRKRDILPQIWNKPAPKARVLIARGTPNEKDDRKRSSPSTTIAQLKFESFEAHQNTLKEWYKDSTRKRKLGFVW